MKRNIKQMVLGIFLMLVSVWSLIFGVVDDIPLFSAVGVFLPVVAVICFFLGFCAKEDRKGNDA